MTKKTAGWEPAALASVEPGSDDQLLSPYAAGKRANVASTTIHKWVAQGRVTAYPAPAHVRRRYGPNAVLVSLSDVRAAKGRVVRRLSASQAATLLGVCYQTVIWYCKRGYLPYRRYGKLYEIDHRTLARFIAIRDAGVPLSEVASTVWDPQLHPLPRLHVPETTRLADARRRRSNAIEYERRRRTRSNVAPKSPAVLVERKRGRWVTCDFPDCPRAHEPFWRWESAIRERNFHDECYDLWRSEYGWPGARRFLTDRDRTTVEGRWKKAAGKKPPLPDSRPRGAPTKPIDPGDLEKAHKMAVKGYGWRRIEASTSLTVRQARTVVEQAKAQAA